MFHGLRVYQPGRYTLVPAFDGWGVDSEAFEVHEAPDENLIRSGSRGELAVVVKGATSRGYRKEHFFLPGDTILELALRRFSVWNAVVVYDRVQSILA